VLDCFLAARLTLPSRPALKRRSLVSLAGADDAGVLPHRNPAPLQRLDHIGIGCLMTARTRAGVSPRQSLSSAMRASMRWEGEAAREELILLSFEVVVTFIMAVVARRFLEDSRPPRFVPVLYGR
jgi:hypothetical protein